MTTESAEPAAVARPMGRSVCGYIRDISHTPGTRTRTMAVILCRNDSPDFPQAQK